MLGRDSRKEHTDLSQFASLLRPDLGGIPEYEPPAKGGFTPQIAVQSESPMRGICGADLFIVHMGFMSPWVSCVLGD